MKMGEGRTGDKVTRVKGDRRQINWGGDVRTEEKSMRARVRPADRRLGQEKEKGKKEVEE